MTTWETFYEFIKLVSEHQVRRGIMIGERVTFTASLPIKYTKRKKWILASRPILDMHSQGETEKKAKKNLEEALSVFFVSCFERGALDAVLKQ